MLASFRWNSKDLLYTIRVDELRKYEQDSNAKGKGWILFEIGYIFAHDLNVTDILADDIGETYCLNN